MSPPPLSVRQSLAIGLWLLGAWLNPLWATERAPASPVTASATTLPAHDLLLAVGESRVLAAPGVARIAVGSGAILTASAIDGREVLLFAQSAGLTTLMVWDRQGHRQSLRVLVQPGQAEQLGLEIQAFLSRIPGAHATRVGDKVIVEGESLRDRDLERIEFLASRYPQILNLTNRLGHEQMVMVDVKVVEFPSQTLRELGLRWQAQGGLSIGGIWSPLRHGATQGYQITAPGGSQNPAPISPANGPSPGSAQPAGLQILSQLNLGLSATLSALAQQGQTTILAAPQLSARNGAKASFLAGGELPYTVSTVNGPTVQFKPYGVRLEVVPRVDRQGHIRATIDTEVSNIDGSVNSAAGPALLTRKTSTEFNVQSGDTIVLSGLVQRESLQQTDKVPGLGDLPVIGALFRSQRFQNRETELVVFVTPTLMPATSSSPDARIQRSLDRLQSGPMSQGAANEPAL
jgi:pilus assembly protein CpaC